MRLTVLKDPQGILGKEITYIDDPICAVDALKTIPSFHYENSEAYLNGQKLRFPIFDGDKCVDRGDEIALTRVLSDDDSLCVFLETKGFDPLTVAIVVAVVSVAAAFLLAPKIPGNVGEEKQSSNNTLYGQENAARLYQAIPDSYGELVLYPDLANAEAYFVYSGNQATLTQYMTVGVGEYTIGSEGVRLGQTRLSQIPGATVVFYTPASELTTIPEYFTSLRVEQVEGQELRGIEGDSVQIDEDFFTAVYDDLLDQGTLEVASPGDNPLFNDVFSPGDNITIVNSDFYYSLGDFQKTLLDTQTVIDGQVSVTFLAGDANKDTIQLVSDDSDRAELVEGIDYTVITDTQITLTQSYPAGSQLLIFESEMTPPSAVSRGVYAHKGINGIYQVVSVTDRQIVVGNVTAGAEDINNWVVNLPNFLAWARSDIRFEADAGLEKPIGPFDTAVRGRGVLLDFNFPRGLKADANIRIEWQTIDEPGGAATGPLNIDNVTYSANSFDVQNRTYTVDNGVSAEFYRVTVVRSDEASQDANIPDLVKWTRMASWQFEANKQFPDNVTMLRVDIPQTEQAVSPRENKVNFDATRRTITYDASIGEVTSTISDSKRFADAVLHMYTVIFGRPSTELDLDGLYEIQDNIDADDPLLGEFSFSFDDIDVGLGERLQTICAVARVTPYLDGDIWRFSREESKPITSGIITRRDIAADREFSRTWSPRLPADVDSVKLEYVNPSDNKKAYITRSYDTSGNIINSFGANPVDIKLAGCRNETQAINRAELEIRKILYERETLSDTLLSQGNLYDIGDKVDYADVYSVDKFDGEIRSILGNTAKTSELVNLDEAKSYTIIFNDELGDVFGPFGVEAIGDKEIQLINGTFGSAYVKDGINIQLGSRYIISEVGDTDPQSFTVTQKEPVGGGNVQLSIKQYDERIYGFD